MSNLIQSTEDYASCTDVPTADQLSLNLVLEYYDTYIEPYIYTYKTKNEESITLKLEHKNFPHLIGTHYAANEKYGKDSDDAKKFRGYPAYKSIKEGTMDKQTIKAINPKKNEHYKDMTKKMRYFFTMDKVLEAPEAVYYNKEKNEKKKNSVLDCDVLLYKVMHNQYIHVGLDKSGEKYVAKTFLIDSEPIFINGQTNIEIEKVEKVRHRRRQA